MIHPSAIKVELRNTYGPGCTHDTVIASLQIQHVNGLNPFRPHGYAEKQYAMDDAARTIWHVLYGDLLRDIEELSDAYFREGIFDREEQRVCFDYFHSKLVHLRAKLNFNQPPQPPHHNPNYQNICQAENQQQQIAGIFSETPTGPVKETSQESQTPSAMCKISQSQWDSLCGALSGKSTGHGSPGPTGQQSSSSTECDCRKPGYVSTGECTCEK